MKVPKPKRCGCGGEADFWIMEMTGTYTVRCSKCQRKTRPHTTIQGAVDEWNETARKGDPT